MNEHADSHYFTERALSEWTRIGQKHRVRDEQFLGKLERWFQPGPILELGAATGHLSAILQARGHDVTASDISPRFVEACRARGLKARIVDATGDIGQQTGQSFATVLAQNVMPLIGRDRPTVLAVLSAINAALNAAGRFISISARPHRAPNPANFFTPREQLEIVRESGLFRVLTVFPHQVVPTALYRAWNARVLNFLDFQLARVAAVRLVSVMEKID